jgi:uncharacterized Fe-S cluster-containing MiaB family protein
MSPCACSCPAGHPAHELEVLQQILGKLSVMHVSKSVKKNAVPFNLPQIDPNVVSASPQQPLSMCLKYRSCPWYVASGTCDICGHAAQGLTSDAAK